MPDPRAIARLYERHGVTPEWVLSGLLRNVPYDVARKIEQNAPELVRPSSTHQSEPPDTKPATPRRHRTAKAPRRDDPDPTDCARSGKSEAQQLAEILP